MTLILYSSYSDDGAMTLALAQSFIDAKGRYDHTLSIKYYLQWMKDGRFSTTDYAWDMGDSTRAALRIWKNSPSNDPHTQAQAQTQTQAKVNDLLDHEDKSGNGSLMRIVPVGVILWKDPKFARKVARAQSEITHPALACLEACDAFTELICRAMRGKLHLVRVVLASRFFLSNSFFFYFLFFIFVLFAIFDVGVTATFRPFRSPHTISISR